MRKHFLVVMSALLCICARTSPADESARAQMKGLDEQVQEVKSDVLSIAAELNQLEEKLLYPSDTHLAVFVSLAHGETLRWNGHSTAPAEAGGSGIGSSAAPVGTGEKRIRRNHRAPQGPKGRRAGELPHPV